jgi:hypothetical protein
MGRLRNEDDHGIASEGFERRKRDKSFNPPTRPITGAANLGELRRVMVDSSEEKAGAAL